jgi:hypothetical protein
MYQALEKPRQIIEWKRPNHSHGSGVSTGSFMDGTALKINSP